jgi:hypothetical protein
MTHEEFRRAYGSGALKVEIDGAGAARYLSTRLLLPLVRLPVLGAGVALALIGWIWTGLAVIAAGIVGPAVIKRSAAQFLLTQALEDEHVYREVTHAQIMRVSPPPAFDVQAQGK